MKEAFLFVVSLLFFAACKTDETGQANCNDLKSALLAQNAEQVNEEVNKLTQDLSPNPTATDQIGHAENLNRLIDRLNAQCSSLQATLGCYACIKTLPAQSEIIIELDSTGTTVKRVVDISTPEGEFLKSINVHR